jgi:hypothetical protein
MGAGDHAAVEQSLSRQPSGVRASAHAIHSDTTITRGVPYVAPDETTDSDWV